MYRVCLGIGILRALLLCLFLIPSILFFLYLQLKNSDSTHYLITGVILIAIILIHKKRKDYNFLLKISDSIILTYYIEYLFFSLPFLLLLVWTHRWIDLGIYLFLLLVIIFLVRPSINGMKRTFTGITNLIPADVFEWKAGVRQNIIFIVFIYIIGCIGAFLHISIPLVCIIVLSMLTWSFNSICESREMLEAPEINSKKVIISKLKQHLTCWLILILPLLVCASVYYPYILYSFIILITLANTCVSAVLLKYAYYIPKMTSVPGMLHGTLFLLISLVPGISVITLFCNFFLYREAIKKLNEYLDDYN